jgi:hypothetical protein
LVRVMRLLSAYGVFEASDGKFRHSPASRMLRTDHPQSMRDYVQKGGPSARPEPSVNAGFLARVLAQSLMTCPGDVHAGPTRTHPPCCPARSKRLG